MFDFVAKNKRFLQIIIALTLVPFAFFGLESYTGSFGRAGDVATVEGSGINQREFGEQLRRQQERLREMFGRNADVADFDTPDTRRAILEAMIAQRLVTAEVIKSRLVMSRESVIATIVGAQEFQENGKFSTERYQNYLRARGLSDEANVLQLQLELPAARLTGAITATAFQPRAVTERLLALEGRRREVSEAHFGADQYLARVKPDAAAVRAYYDGNQAEFRTPERVRAEYVVLSAEELAKGEPVTDAELKVAYDARAAQLGSAEQRQASHILVATKAEAEKIAAEARKSPDAFAALAKKHSQDSGSAENGGDLGLVTRGSLASKALEDALFALKEKEVSGAVQTEFGFHVLRLASIQKGKAPSFDDVRKELTAELGKQKAAKKFAEAADGFSNMVYEQADSLKPAAERYKLKVEKSDWLARQAPPQGPLAHPKLVAALFSSDAIQQRRNTDAVEVAPGILVAARVAEHQAAAQRPFDEVKADVEKKLAMREAATLARKEGEAALETLRKGGSASIKWNEAKVVSRRDSKGIAEATVGRIMAADAAKLPAYVGAMRGDAGYSIYRVSKVLETPPLAEDKKAAELQRLEDLAGNTQLEAWIAGVRARSKVDINKANLEKK